MGYVVLRFERTDVTNAFILVQVSPNGTRSLDVKLIGTEGEYPYMIALRQNQIPSLKVKNAPCSDAEWQSTLEALVRGEPQGDVEATATLESGTSITLTLRKRIGDVTQRLGSITLSHSPKEEIELLDWCGSSTLASIKAKEDLVTANAKVSQLELAVAELKAQLDELIEAKESTEAAWLEKFRDLINEKKLRIREQQKILESVPPPGEADTNKDKDNEEEAEEGEEAPPPARRGRKPAAASKAKAAPKKTTRAAAPSRPGKRKKDTVVDVKEEEISEDEPDPTPPASTAADEMELDQQDEQAQLSEDRQTTDDDATASEADTDEEEQEVVKRATRSSKTKTSVPAQKASTKTSNEPASSETGESKPTTNAQEKIPPKRDLPFNAGKKKSPAPPQPNNDESETDDEL